MKRYNLSEIMRNAHRTYKFSGKKQGKTFAQVLKSTWRLAKLDVAMQESEMRMKERVAKESADFKNRKPAEVVSYNFLGDVYNRNSKGRMGAQYCGD